MGICAARVGIVSLTVSTPATKTFLSSCVYALPSASPLSLRRLHGILHSDRFRATQMAAPGPERSFETSNSQPGSGHSG